MRFIVESFSKFYDLHCVGLGAAYTMLIAAMANSIATIINYKWKNIRQTVCDQIKFYCYSIG